MVIENFDEIIKKYRDLQYIGSGNSSDCYLVDDENVLLVKNIDEVGYKIKLETTKILQAKVDSLKEQGVNIYRTKEIRYDQGTMYVLQERAEGKSLYKKWADRFKRDKRYKDLSTEDLDEKFEKDILESQNIVKKADQSQIEKYISDYLKMVDEGIFWDSTFENLIYDENKGFSFIDIDDGRKYAREEFMNNEMYIYGDIIKPLVGNVEGIEISEELRKSTKEVLEKVISIMQNTKKEDIQFSEDVLSRVIDLVNEKFEFNIGIEEKNEKSKKDETLRNVLEQIHEDDNLKELIEKRKQECLEENKTSSKQGSEQYLPGGFGRKILGLNRMGKARYGGTISASSDYIEEDRRVRIESGMEDIVEIVPGNLDETYLELFEKIKKEKIEDLSIERISKIVFETVNEYFGPKGDVRRKIRSVSR